MSTLSKAFSLLLGNGTLARGKRHTSPERKRGTLGMRSLRMEPLEVRTLLSFSAAIEIAAGVAPFPAPAQVSPTNVTPVKYEVTFGSAIENATFTGSDISFAGSHQNAAPYTPLTAAELLQLTATPTMVDASHYTVSVAIAGANHDWDIHASIPANSVRAVATPFDYNLASTSVDNLVNYDNVVPSVTINQEPFLDPTTATTVHYTAVFSEAVTGFNAACVTVAGTAGATTATVTNPLADNKTFEVDVTGMTGDGYVTATIGAGVVHDKAGNLNTVSTSTHNSVYFNIPLVITGFGPADGVLDPTHSQAATTGPTAPGLADVHFTAVFNEPLASFPTSAVTTTFTSGAVGTVTAVTAVAGTVLPNTMWDITVRLTNPGVVQVSLAAGAVHDVSGELSPASGLSLPVTYSATAPVLPTVVVTRTSGATETVSGAIMQFTAVFSEGVTGFTASDISLTNGSVTFFTPTGVGGTNYYFEVGGMSAPLTADCVVTATVNANVATAIATPAGRQNIHSTSTAVGSNTVTFNIPLAVTLARATGQLDPTNTLPINYTVVFNEPVADFVTGHVTLTTTGTGTLVGTVTGSGTTYNVAVTGATSNGTVSATIPVHAAHDASGEFNALASATVPVVYTNLGPTVGITVSPATSTGAPVVFTVTFSQDILASTISGTSLTVQQDAGGNLTWGTVAAPVNVSAAGHSNVWEFTVTGFGANQHGHLVGRMAAAVAGTSNVVTNLTGNYSQASPDTPTSVVTTPNTLTASITKKSDQAVPGTVAPVNFTVVFSQAVTEFLPGDVTVVDPWAATDTVGNPFHVILQPAVGIVNAVWKSSSPSVIVTDSGDHKTFNVAVGGQIGDGNVTIQIAAGVVQTATAITNGAAGPTTVAFDLPLGVTINRATGQAAVTNASPIRFTAVFNEVVTNFSSASVLLAAGFPAGSTVTVTNNVINDRMTYDVAVSGMTVDGTVTASIPAGAVTDNIAPGDNDPQVNTASTSTGLGNTVVYDTVHPTVTINKAVGQVTPTNTQPIGFTVVFSEPVTGFGTGSVTLAGTATGVLVGTVTGSGTTYQVAVTGITGAGTVIATIAADKAIDEAGNGNVASTSTINTVTYDATRPTVTLVGPASPTTISPIVFTTTFSEVVTGFGVSGVALSGTATGTLVAVVTGSGTTYSVSVSGMTGPGTVIATIAAGAATSAAGNTNVASTPVTVTYNIEPVGTQFYGDFNGDGIQESLRQNQTSGNVYIGVPVMGGYNWSILGTADPTLWQVRATGDFNGNGTSDVLWQGISGSTTGVVGAWIIHSSAITGWAGLGTANPTEWMIAGTGNFSVSGRLTTDILWQAVSGANLGLVGAWKINNNVLVGWAGFNSAPPSVWKITGTIDVNGDGINDVNWRTPITGVPTTQGSYIIKNYAVTAWQAGAPLNAVSEVAPASGVAALSQSDLQLMVHEGIARWASTGLDAASIAKLGQVDFAIENLNGTLLGTADANRVTIDSNAAGNGWFIDQTPADDAEFADLVGAHALSAGSSVAANRADLLTAVMHEMGHVLGYDDASTDDGLMSAILPLGVRQTLAR